MKGPQPPVKTMEGGSIDKLPKLPVLDTKSDAKSVNEEAEVVVTPAEDTLCLIAYRVWTCWQNSVENMS